LGGLTAVEIWGPMTPLILVAWILMVVAPRWKYTPTITLISSTLFALLYTLVGLSIMTRPDAPAMDFAKLEGVVQIFKNPNAVFFGWIHYLAFDPMIGRLMLLESLEYQVSLTFHFCVMVPTLILTFWLGPCGFLVYTVIVRPIMALVFQAKKQKEKSS
jgi:hypothetical protein